MRDVIPPIPDKLIELVDVNGPFSNGDLLVYNFSTSEFDPVSSSSFEAADPALQAHLVDTGNPHSVTKSQVGLGNVENTDTTTTANISDAFNKRFVTDAELLVLLNTSGVNTGDQDLSGYTPISRQVNGHALSSDVTVTKGDVGLGNVTNDTQLKVTDLDTDGTLSANSDSKIPSQKAVKTYVDANNYIPNTDFKGFGLPILTGLKGKRGNGILTVNGNKDIYTVPAGKKALIGLVKIFNQVAAGTITFHPQIKIGATYYRIGTDQTVGNNAVAFVGAFGATPFYFLLEAGETYSIAANGVGNVTAKILEFDNTVPIVCTKVTDFSASPITVYTCPAGKTAHVINMLQNQHDELDGGTVFYCNESGALMNGNWHQVPNGDVLGNANKIAASFTANNNSPSTLQSIASMEAGDKVMMTSDRTGQQIVFCTVIELEA